MPKNIEQQKYLHLAFSYFMKKQNKHNNQNQNDFADLDSVRLVEFHSRKKKQI